VTEERLQEIKDSISLQYKVQEANELNNFNIFTDEEQELVEEIERLNKIRQQVIDELFDLKNMIYKPETREINFDVQNKISSIIKILGSDKEWELFIKQKGYGKMENYN